jgi:hypothetical protein
LPPPAIHTLTYLPLASCNIQTVLNKTVLIILKPNIDSKEHKQGSELCADEKAHEWSLFKRAKVSTKSFTIIRSVRAAIAQARRRLLRSLRVTAAAANRAHAAHAFVAGPLFKESATAFEAATVWYRV